MTARDTLLHGFMDRVEARNHGEVACDVLTAEKAHSDCAKARQSFGGSAMRVQATGFRLICFTQTMLEAHKKRLKTSRSFCLAKAM